MEYVKGKSYFCFSEQKIKQYNYLNEDIKCDILIIGRGIDGAIANFYLSQKFNVVLVNKGRLGMACTSCATALLEYQLDDFASDLLKYMSKEEIIATYKMGLDATKKIKSFINTYGNHCNFALRPTFLYTNSIFTVNKIKEEYNFRISNGFNCQLFDKSNNPFPFDIKCGIFAKDGGCEFNPYLFTKQMIENSKNQDKIFENTNIKHLIKTKNGYTAKTNFREIINCKKVLIATGFNWEVLNCNDLCDRFITYSIVTSPIKELSWLDKALIHDASSPYHYMRTLPDGRIIFSGEDTIFNGSMIKENKCIKKYKKLEKDLLKLLPNIKDKINIDYKFYGCFGTTKNNLGLIGKSKIDDNILLFISCGANGIINAMKGIEIIEDIIQEKYNPLSDIFSPKRKV